MADGGLAPKTENRGGLVGKWRGSNVADEIDAPMDLSEATISEPALYLPGTDAMGEELPPPNRAVLKVCESADDHLNRSRPRLSPHTDDNPAGSCNAPAGSSGFDITP
jgi:hypothetical protein